MRRNVRAAGKCIPDCPEGALQLIDGKSRLVSDLFCDGLGACIGTCPEGAISVVEREAEAYDGRVVMENIARQRGAVIKAHLEHLLDHGERDLYNQAIEYLIENSVMIPDHDNSVCLTRPVRSRGNPFAGCPGAAVRSFARKDHAREETRESIVGTAAMAGPAQARKPPGSVF